MFPFGNRSNDNVVDRAIVEVEGPIMLPAPFPFYRIMEKKLYVGDTCDTK